MRMPALDTVIGGFKGRVRFPKVHPANASNGTRPMPHQGQSMIRSLTVSGSTLSSSIRSAE